MKNLKGISFLTALLLVGSAQAANIGGVLKKAKDVKDVVEAFTIDDKKEIQIGKQIHPQLLSEMGGAHRDKKLQQYVNQVGQKLAKRCERNNIPYTFTVVNANYANAFAIPGGFVYITNGLLTLMRDEAELASVLGHEIGHVVGRHGVEKIRSMIVAQKATDATGQLGGPLLKDLTTFFAKAALSGYGRDQELEADRLGLHNANNTSYDPNGAVRLFEHFLALEKKEGAKQSGLDKLFASHPPTNKRIELAKKEIKALTKFGKTTNEKQYLSMRKLAGN